MIGLSLVVIINVVRRPSYVKLERSLNYAVLETKTRALG